MWVVALCCAAAVMKCSYKRSRRHEMRSWSRVCFILRKTGQRMFRACMSLSAIELGHAMRNCNVSGVVCDRDHFSSGRCVCAPPVGTTAAGFERSKMSGCHWCQGLSRCQEPQSQFRTMEKAPSALMEKVHKATAHN